ncbi:3-oxo-5-alpha-steroid 4-dehydrogenase-domain-containing protein [Hypoxylon sp. NC1633]|nr:3-oxo-5-alpha-steroid 4-dehydrogenase-domain-containing protein [Hypoxylon sp. NC1633]
MADLTLKVTNRSRKGLKGLPPSIDLPNDATIEDAKIAVAKAARVSDHNRIGVFDPVSKKTIKDRNSLLREHAEVLKRGELVVKDLGPQIDWRTVYVIEYLGPLIFHPLFFGLRKYIYPPAYSLIRNYLPAAAQNATGELSFAQQAAFVMIGGHFVKRELETIFLHKFGSSTMPFNFVFRNSFFYWSVAGLLGAIEIYAPFSPAALSPATPTPLAYLGIALYLLGEAANFDVHYYLAHLRRPGETARKIPRGHGFGLVTCPNYMWEVVAWIGVILVTRSPSLVLFIAIGCSYMRTWGWGKEMALRTLFPNEYKKKRYVVIPGLF